jgi:flagellar biosynthesis protein FliP
MPKAKKKTNKEKALKAAEAFDKNILSEDGNFQAALRRIFTPFRKWHAEQMNKVDFETYFQMQNKGPMAAIEKLEKLIREIKRDLGGSTVEWCHKNQYK